MYAKVVDLAAAFDAGHRGTQCQYARKDDRVAAYACRIRKFIGMPAMKATSRLLALTLTPTCHSLMKPGGCRALCATSKS